MTHGHRGKKASGTYNSWRAMLQRCHYHAHPFYPAYGGRGIVVCPRWRLSFVAFLADMGERPAGHTLDRIDVDGNYEPGNCRWADSKMQRWNRRDFAGRPMELEIDRQDFAPAAELAASREPW
jgi:hypothetical protein